MSRYSRIRHYHREMIARFGANSSLAQGWREPDDQLKRFEILSAIGDLDHKTVLDAGCGYADLYPYLKSRYPNLRHYTGIEQLSHFAKHATLRYPEADIIEGDFLSDLPGADYVLASGSLNYSSKKKDFIYTAIQNLYHASGTGLGFNLLRSVNGKGILTAYDPQYILDIAKTLSTSVRLIDDYLAEDFTIFMYK